MPHVWAAIRAIHQNLKPELCRQWLQVVHGMSKQIDNLKSIVPLKYFGILLNFDAVVDGITMTITHRCKHTVLFSLDWNLKSVKWKIRIQNRIVQISFVWILVWALFICDSFSSWTKKKILDKTEFIFKIIL